MSITVSDLKEYFRVTHNNDDTLLSKLLETAKSLAYEKTGISYKSGDYLYEQLLTYYVQHFYDDRAAFVDKETAEFPYSITHLEKTITYRGEIEPSEEQTEQVQQTQQVQEVQQTEEI